MTAMTFAARGCRRTARIILVLGLVLASAPLFIAPAKAAAADPEKAVSRYITGCEGAGSGKPDAVYACALDGAVKGGGIDAAVATACRADVGDTPRKPAFEAWKCATLRQFGPQMTQKDWQSATFNECDRQSRRAGHLYARDSSRCMVDALIDQKRVSDATIEACRASKAASSSHGLMNCLTKPQPVAAAAADAGVAPGAPAKVAAPPAPPQPQPANRTAEQVRQAEDARFPPAEVRATMQTWCTNSNRPDFSSAMRYDCTCVMSAVDRHLAEGKLPRRAIAHQQFDMNPCVDRPATAKRMFQVDEPTRYVARTLGTDAEAIVACRRRVYEQELDVASLSDAGAIRAAVTRGCSGRK